jgi:hypothetical protein
VQCMDIIDILLECLTGDIEKGVTIRLDGLTLTPFTKEWYGHLHGVHPTVDRANTCLTQTVTGSPWSTSEGDTLSGVKHPRSNFAKRVVQHFPGVHQTASTRHA